MRLLIDTHVLVWWRANDARLNPRVRAVVSDPAHIVHVSIVSFWELSIKWRKGKFDQSGVELLRYASAEGFSILGVDLAHLDILERLRKVAGHNDPFDHLILAQAKAERMMLMTGDRAMMGYDVPCIGIG